MNPTTLKLRRTGKLFLICALICAGQMYGMERINPQPQQVGLGNDWQSLPDEVKSLILVALAQSGDDLDEAMGNIIRMSMVNKGLYGMVNDLKVFTKIVHVLANTFKNTFDTPYAPYDIAELYGGMPIAIKYVELYDQLLRATRAGDIAKAKQLIEDGVDINAMRILSSLLNKWTSEPKLTTDMVKLLLDHGANPNAIGMQHQTALEYLNANYQGHPEYKEIKALLENAMQKYQK